MFAIELRFAIKTFIIPVGNYRFLRWCEWAGLPVRFVIDGYNGNENIYVAGRRCVLLA